MPFEIINRFTDEVIFSSENTESVKTCVEEAVKRGATLTGAYLFGAYLSGVVGLNKFLCTPLLMLLDQPGKIRAYKLTDDSFRGPFYRGLTYETGKELVVKDANCDDSIDCAPGISLATLDWCMREWKPGYHILIAEFEAGDIAAIPVANGEKFRVKRCVIVGEKDLKEIGLI